MLLLRRDIVITPLQNSSGCKLYDEHHDKTYEFGEVEHYLIQQFQKPYHIGEVVARCNECFDQKLSEQDVGEFLSLLTEWNLLREDDTLQEGEGQKTVDENSAEDNRDSAALSRELRMPNQWHLFNPQHLFDSLNKLFLPFRKLVWLIPFIFAFGLATAVSHPGAFITNILEANGVFGIIGRIFIAAVTINLISQTARGLVARHYQLATPSFGVTLVFGLIPRFNVQIDVGSDLSRSARIWLSAVPPIISLLMFSFATVLWAVTVSSGSFLASVGAEIVFVATIGFIFMANPFVGNGVALLSAVLDIPNLRERSRLAMAGLFFNQPDVIKKHSGKHRIGFALYGLVSAMVIIFFIGFISYLIFDILERKYQGTGAAVFLFLAAYLTWFIRRGKKAQKAYRHLKQEQRGIHSSHERSDSKLVSGLGNIMSGGWDNSVSGRKKLYRGALLIIFAVVMILPYHYETSGKAEVFPIAKASISFETSGIIDHIFVDEGDWVAVGDKLASIENYKQKKDVNVTGATIRSKRFAIAQLLTTPSSEEIQLAKEALKTAELQFKYSSEDLERITPLYKNGVITLDDYEAARKDADLKWQQKQEARLSLEALLKQVNPNQIESLKADVDALKHEAKFYEEELQGTYLTSPIQGRVISQNLKFKEHSYITAGDVFIEIENTRTVSVRIAVPESDVGDAQPGALVRLKLWAYPNITFSGKVDEVEPATAAEEAEYGRVVYVKSRIDNPDGLLISGLTGHAKITGSETVAILAFTRAFIRFLFVEVWSWFP